MITRGYGIEGGTGQDRTVLVSAIEIEIEPGLLAETTEPMTAAVADPVEIEVETTEIDVEVGEDDLTGETC